MSTQDHITITPANSEQDSQNFKVLKEVGIDYLQSVVGHIWTDYNVHDPGVTILEELCYAITDITYRLGLDIEDILAINPEDSSATDLNNFFTAREILPNAPVTQPDFRKLLIDIDGIRNAWLEKTTKSEVRFYADMDAGELTYTKDENQQILLNGLYEVLIEFDRDDTYGDLNDNTLETELEITSGDLTGLIIDITVEFPYWSDEWPAGKSWDSLTDINDSIKSIMIEVTEQVDGYEVEITVSPTNDISVQVSKTTGTSIVNKPSLANQVKTAIEDLFDTTGAGANNILVTQQEKVATTLEVVERAKAVLHANRDLCEDFVRFIAPKVEEIFLCTDIELEPDADPEEVLTEIYYQVGNHLAPRVNFYTFAQMLEKGWTTEEIFEGPRLDHGFIDNHELEKSERLKSIHVSDLINIIMDIKGVVAVKKMEIANIALGDSTILSKSAHWCLDLAWEKNFVPRLSPERSKVRFFKRGIPFVADEEEVEDLLEAKLAEEEQLWSGTWQEDLTPPKGNYYRLEDYSSIQLDFPENYGIGDVGLPANASDKRIAQAKQLKGYLLFFDQILANYCSQLAHVRHLFSMNGDIERTYFNQPLYDIPNVATLYREFIEEVELTRNPGDDNESDINTAWETFSDREDANSNDHEDALNQITEDIETFYRRRNAFLDHLLARFCEQFADYAMLAYSLEGKKNEQEQIDDKVAFLSEYPEISYGRGLGFNYLQSGWESSNVSGFQKRVSRLLGIDNYNRRNLACPPVESYFTKTKISGKWVFRMRNLSGDTMLRSIKFGSLAARNSAYDWLLENVSSMDQFELTDDGFELYDDSDTLIASSITFPDPDERDAALEEVVNILKGECSGEGFYLLEHILVRPRSKDDDFLPVNFSEDCFCEGNEDPYSFRATCIMPYWTGRFTNMDFRRFVEQTLREECPAHVFLKICWVNPEQMTEFQKAYKEWLGEMQNCPPKQNQLTWKQNKLIEVLRKLRNVYPVSYLYDCQESDKSAMTLGQSILGTFIPKEDE